MPALSGKMSPIDPYPAPRSDFDRMLEEVELLVVVGFSFWDDHMTALIRRWLALDERRKLIIVGPYFDTAATPMRVLVDALCQDCGSRKSDARGGLGHRPDTCAHHNGCRWFGRTLRRPKTL